MYKHLGNSIANLSKNIFEKSKYLVKIFLDTSLIFSKIIYISYTK